MAISLQGMSVDMEIVCVSAPHLMDPSCQLEESEQNGEKDIEFFCCKLFFLTRSEGSSAEQLVQPLETGGTAGSRVGLALLYYSCP